MIDDFEHFLRINKENGNNAAVKYIRYLEKVTRIAIANKWMVDEAVSEDMQKMRSKFDGMDDTNTPLAEKPTDFVREPIKKRGRPRKRPEM